MKTHYLNSIKLYHQYTIKSENISPRLKCDVGNLLGNVTYIEHEMIVPSLVMLLPIYCMK